MQNPLLPSSAPEPALPGAPSPAPLVARHLEVSKPSHSRLRGETGSKCSPQTQAPPLVNRGSGSTKGTQSGPGRWVRSRAEAVLWRLAGGRDRSQRRKVSPRRRGSRSCVHGRGSSGCHFCWVKHSPPLARCGSDAAGRQRLARCPAPKRRLAGLVPGAGRLGWQSPLLRVPHSHAPSPRAQLSLSSATRGARSPSERAIYRSAAAAGVGFLLSPRAPRGGEGGEKESGDPICTAPSWRLRHP